MHGPVSEGPYMSLALGAYISLALIASPIERERERLHYQDLEVKNACGISAQK